MAGHKNFRELQEPIYRDPKRLKRVRQLKKELEYLTELLDDWTDLGLIANRLSDAYGDVPVMFCDDVWQIQLTMREGCIVQLLFDKDGRLVGINAGEGS